MKKIELLKKANATNAHVYEEIQWKDVKNGMVIKFENNLYQATSDSYFEDGTYKFDSVRVCIATLM